MASSDDSAPRWEFGNYEVIGELGRGGMGVVYRARQRNLERPVALKMLVGEGDPRDLARFEREAVAAARIDHPGVVRVYEAGQLHGQSYFAMELVEGEDLERRTSEAPLPPREAARLLASVARAVQHLHDQGVLHRDLKPSNILLDADGVPKVTDFGIARFLAAGPGETTTGAVFGSPSYMAPEQASPELGPLGPATDVHGLGAVLYRTLTGQPPNRGETAMETMLQAIRSAPVPPRQIASAVPPALEAICLRCLERSPARRYGSAGEVAADLERFIAGEPVEAAAGGLRDRVRRWLLRETNFAVHLLTLLVVAAAKLAAFLARGSRTDLLVGGGVGLWIVACGGLQLLGRRRAEGILWGVTDVAFLTWLLLLTHGVASPALLGYPLVIISAGLWMRVRPVLVTTAASAAACLVLILDAELWHPSRRLPPDGYVIVGVAVLAAGALVARHVRRARALGLHRR